MKKDNKVVKPTVNRHQTEPYKITDTQKEQARSRRKEQRKQAKHV